VHHPHKIKFFNIPWHILFRSTATLALFFNTFVQGWIGLMILSEMPNFLHQQLGKDVTLHFGAIPIISLFILNIIIVT
jgi:hypothetical protein